MPDRRRRQLLVLGAALAALPALARPRSGVRRLGLLLLVSSPALTGPFFAALADRGWVPGRNLEVDTRFTAAQQGHATEIARELVEKRADVLVAVSTANAVASRTASTSVPIVMLGGGYPVESGLAGSLAHPGGNVTGVSIYAGLEVFGKQVALAKELVSPLRELGVFWGYAPPAFPRVEMDLALAEMRHAAEALKIRLRVWVNGSQQELEANLAAAAGAPIEALFVTSGVPQASPENIERIARLCEQRRLPTLCDVPGAFFSRGGLLTYSADIREVGSRGASLVDRILRGARPGDLPIEQPTRFELIVNRKRADVIGMRIPRPLLARADRVIE